MNNKIESERDGMKNGINIKNVIVSLVFLIIGIGMLLFVLFVVLPAMTHNAKVCTLEVEAVVIENEPYWTTTGDGESVRRYRQIVEYTVGYKTYTLTFMDEETDPVPEGTKMPLWVDPDNPYTFINKRDITWVDIAFHIAIPIGIMLFGILGLFFNLKSKKTKEN